MKRNHISTGNVPEVLEVHYEAEDGIARLTLNVPLTFEALAAALYMDGSKSMYGNYGVTGTGLLARMGRHRNGVQDVMRSVVPYVAGLDANRSVRVAYWACGSGDQIEVVGELNVDNGATANYPGPQDFGDSTHMVPTLRDFVAYVKGLIAAGEVVQNALAVIVTDGVLHDAEAVTAYGKRLLAEIDGGNFPNTSISVIGVGPDVDEEQLEELSEEVGRIKATNSELFHDALAEDIDQLGRVVSHLIGKQQVAFDGGARLVGPDGNTIVSFEDKVPAMIEFPLKADGPVTLKLIATGGEITFTVDPSDAC